MALAHTTKPFPALPPRFASLEPLLRKMTAKDPRDRFKTADQLAQEAKAWLQTRSGDQPSLPVRKRTASAIVLVLAVIAAGGGWMARDLPWGRSLESTTTPADPATPLDPAEDTPGGNEGAAGWW